jgi:hypothetical protein
LWRRHRVGHKLRSRRGRATAFIALPFIKTPANSRSCFIAFNKAGATKDRLRFALMKATSRNCLAASAFIKAGAKPNFQGFAVMKAGANTCSAAARFLKAGAKIHSSSAKHSESTPLLGLCLIAIRGASL